MLCSDLIREYVDENNFQQEDYLFPIKSPIVNQYLKRVALRTFGNKENFYRGLASFQDVAKKTGESVKEVKKRFDADWKAVDDAIKYIQSDKKNNKVITEITTVNPGHAVVNYEEKVPLSEINFNETLPFDIKR